ncbi:MAG TPA: amidohydrolase family protein [Ktedonobacteraceae bacterium]
MSMCIDPAKGKMGAREARRLLEKHGARGFKFHRTLQEFYPNDPQAYPLYEVIAAAGLPAIFHTGHSGIGTGMRGGGGVRLKYSNPMYLDDVAVDFPDIPIIMAHPHSPGRMKPSLSAQTSGLYRPLRLVPQILPAPTYPVPQYPAQAQNALR